MTPEPLKILAVVGSLRRASITRVVVQHLAARWRAEGCEVDVLDLRAEPLPFYCPDTAGAEPWFAALRERVLRADVYLLGSPDYHGSISGVLKNFLDCFWREFTGKLFASVVASHEKGLTVTDQLRTVARQCYAWSLPYQVSFTEDEDVRDGQIVSESLRARLGMMARDVRVYGSLLAQQRRADLAGNEPGFMARLRS
ncbi:MAG: NAD(P)H-dependent oxidoreductase [Verrucomicrobiae bacterium]|nr:NAD(P)H-dependent oxidoreductase [Verrucomicrobiae bacterium]